MTNAEFKKLLWDAAVKLRGSLSAGSGAVARTARSSPRGVGLK